MATVKIRYLVQKPGRDDVTRRFWQPSPKLRAAGWPPVSLRDAHGGWLNLADAMAAAEEINTRVDAWYLGLADGAPMEVAAAPGDRTLGALIDVYERSPEFKGLAPRTRKDYAGYNRRIDAWGGERPAISLTPKTCKSLYALIAKDGTTSAARHVTLHLQTLLTWARGEDWFPNNWHNPAAKLKLPAHKAARGKLWTRAMVDHVVANADRMGWHSIGTAIIVNEWMGQNPVDLLALTRAQFDSGRFQVTRTKTREQTGRRTLSPKVAARIREEIDRQAARGAGGILIFISERKNEPWGQNNFTRWFRRVINEAAKTMPACRELQFRYLRHTMVTRAAAAGVPLNAICQLSGHNPKSIVNIIDTYTIDDDEVTDAITAQILEYEDARARKDRS
ncbi:MAG: site-specific integrase [Planctomycetota bacterium]